MQIAVDTKHNLIAEQQVHSKVTDLGLLAETATAARENLGVDTTDAVADRGYFKIEDIEGCEANGVTPFVPKPDRSLARSRGRFPKSAFRYDSESDSYICPAGRSLEPRYRGKVAKHRDGAWTISYFNWAACRSCELRDKCTSAAYRKIVRYENEATLDRMAERLAARPEVMARRRESVEHPFGTIKRCMGQGTFLTRRRWERPWRVQPDSAGLQSPARDQPGRRQRHGCRRKCLSGVCAPFLTLRTTTGGADTPSNASKRGAHEGDPRTPIATTALGSASQRRSRREDRQPFAVGSFHTVWRTFGEIAWWLEGNLRGVLLPR